MPFANQGCHFEHFEVERVSGSSGGLSLTTFLKEVDAISYIPVQFKMFFLIGKLSLFHYS